MDSGFIPDDYKADGDWNRSEETWMRIDELQTEEIEQQRIKIDQLKETIKNALAISDLWTWPTALPWSKEFEEHKKQLDELKESFEKALGEL